MCLTEPIELMEPAETRCTLTAVDYRRRRSWWVGWGSVTHTAPHTLCLQTSLDEVVSWQH